MYFKMLLKIFARNVYFGGYLNKPWHAFIVYMFRRRQSVMFYLWPEMLHSVGDNALISGFGKGPMRQSVMFYLWQRRPNPRTQPLMFPYTIGGQQLQHVTHHPYLGIELTDDLSWGPHLEKMIPKAQRTLNLLRRNLSDCS